MRNSGVLFRGKGPVIDAYEANEIPSWAIWHGTSSLIFKYLGDSMVEGADLLGQAIDKLRKAGTEAPMILKVYENPGKSITNKTPFDNSFPFSLWDPHNGDFSPAGDYRGGSSREALDELKAENAALKAELEDQDEPEQSVIGKVIGMFEPMLAKPEVQQAIMMWAVDKVQKLLRIKTPTAMAGVTPMNEQTTTGSAWETLAPEQQQQLTEAIEILMKADPLIGEHLMGLAVIARDQPSKYKMALTFL